MSELKKSLCENKETKNITCKNCGKPTHRDVAVYCSNCGRILEAK